MNYRRIQTVGESLTAWAKDPPADFDHLIYITIQQLQEQLNTARNCPAEVDG